MAARVMVGLGWKAAAFVSLERLSTYSLLQGLDMGDGWWWKYKLRLETCKKNSKRSNQCNLIWKDLMHPSCPTKIGNGQSQGSFHITHHGIWRSQTTCVDHLHKLIQIAPVNLATTKNLCASHPLSVCRPEVAIEVTPPRSAKTLSQTSFALRERLDNDVRLGN